jgi:hypothetical protein
MKKLLAGLCLVILISPAILEAQTSSGTQVNLNVWYPYGGTKIGYNHEFPISVTGVPYFPSASVNFYIEKVDGSALFSVGSQPSKDTFAYAQYLNPINYGIQIAGSSRARVEVVENGILRANGYSEIFTISPPEGGPGTIPHVDLKVNGSDGPVTINSIHDVLTLTWSSSSPSPYYCWTGQGFADWQGILPNNGYRVVRPSTSLGTTSLIGTSGITYEINCTNNSSNLGSYDKVVIHINSPKPTVILNFPTLAVQSGSGMTSELVWTSTNATRCQSNGWTNSTATQGNARVYFGKDTAYTMTCYNSVGEGTTNTVYASVGTKPIATTAISAPAQTPTMTEAQKQETIRQLQILLISLMQQLMALLAQQSH